MIILDDDEFIRDILVNQDGLSLDQAEQIAFLTPMDLRFLHYNHVSIEDMDVDELPQLHQNFRDYGNVDGPDGMDTR